MPKYIDIKGARTNNLKNIDVKIPRDKLVVVTGVSGSGKSSLAFETLYAEGQRRYIESLSSYARQFLGQMDKPDVDSIEGLSPAISIDQKTTSKNPRSTVGTVTEIYDYLRLLYARIGVPHCPICGKVIAKQSVDQIVDRILAFPQDEKIIVMAPVIRGQKGEHQKVFADAKKSGFVRAMVDGNIYDLSEEIALEKNKKHTIEIVVDRLKVREDIRSRLADSIEVASKLTNGIAHVLRENGETVSFSQNFACEEHGVSIDELTPRLFSFNNPYGACPTCGGLGMEYKIDPDMIVPNKDLSINQGAIKASGWALIFGSTISNMYIKALAEHYGFSLDTPYRDLPQNVQDIIMYGTGDERIKIRRENEYGSGVYYAPFEGIVNNLKRRYAETKSTFMRAEIELSMSHHDCPTCHGKRLKDVVLAVTVGGKNIYDFTSLSIAEELDFVNALELTEREQFIAGQILGEIKARLGFLKNVGLDYLTLARASATLSGGESQRIRLATQISTSLTGVIYILDEPSIGLHQKDNSKLIAALKDLRDLGNTLVVVEHDEETMWASDYLIDIGPGAGIHGGKLISCGTPAEVAADENSLTGRYLSGKLRIPVPEKRRQGNGLKLKITGAAANNLHNINVEIPLGTLTCVTGVSGSGKSSLINEVMCRVLSTELNRTKNPPAKVEKIEGIENLDKIIIIDQSPIGRTPRSNPATYTGVFSDIRNVFAATPEAKLRGYTSGRFSFNVKGGRCEACEGDGIVKFEMHFLSDVYAPCDVCHGTRFNRETLEVKYKGKSIADVLDMTVEEAMNFFEIYPQIYRKLKTLFDVGLGYIKLGQPSTTISGGEAQRVKLATELSKKPTGKTIYVLDEPTTGLHTDDVKKLTEVLARLVDAGNTAVVIEHNLDLIKTADYIIDLGPGGGVNGGKVITSGTPEQVAKCKKSFTGEYLAKIL